VYITGMYTQTSQISSVFLYLEGTLIQPLNQQEVDVKAAVGCPADQSINDFIRNLPNSGDKAKVLLTLEQIDLNTVREFHEVSGIGAILDYLRSKDLRIAIISQSGRSSVSNILERVSSFSILDNEVVICREDVLEHEPNTSPIQLAAQQLTMPQHRILVVASDPAILHAAHRVGAGTVLLDPSVAPHSIQDGVDFQISQIEELKKIVRLRVPLPSGKLPNDLLREFLDQFVFEDPSILINPGVGEDIAAVNVESEEVLVLKSDPITFATDSISQYAVLVNANDIATSGAKPRWFLTTLLFPPGVTASKIHCVVNELKEYCQHWHITLCGGHTEITDAVTRPVVTGMMAGTVTKDNLIDKRKMAPGDHVLLTKAVAVEGTAIIAREFGDRLKRLGMADSAIDRCREFLANISIISEAQIAAGFTSTSAMHDVTEGGLATALEELSIAGNHRININRDSIPVFPETHQICHLLGINPLGLIGSGSLLICCRKADCQQLMTAIRAAGIDVTCIGEVAKKGQGIRAYISSHQTEWPQFEVDEITRLFTRTI
jgi:hydrogenase maturation factor/beta-phosphoglucomutase-like phosphatase (HAD superfamily)